MSGHFPYTAFTDRGDRLRPIGDFAALEHAVAAARQSLTDPKVELVVVNDEAGILVFAASHDREWSRELMLCCVPGCSRRAEHSIVSDDGTDRRPVCDACAGELSALYGWEVAELAVRAAEPEVLTGSLPR